MAFDLIPFAIARNEATSRGLADGDASRIGIVGAMAGGPILALVVGRAMASNLAPAPAAVIPPPEDPPKPTVEEAVAKAEAAGRAAEQATAAAAAAAGAADEVKQVVVKLGEEVKASLDKISYRLDQLEKG